MAVYIPAVVIFVAGYYTSQSKEEQAASVLLVLLQPGLILIDHGHFQFNSVSLGFSVLAVTALGRRGIAADCLGSFLFCLALNYKQMALYYALPFFCYILGRIREGGQPLRHFLCVAATVIVTFGVCWAPWIYSKESALQVLGRLFPFNRGIYEDKVANFWGATSLVLKWKRWFSQQGLIRLSLGATVVGLLPSMVDVFRFPTQQRFLYALGCSAFSFYLFSFQAATPRPSVPCIEICAHLDTP